LLFALVATLYFPTSPVKEAAKPPASTAVPSHGPDKVEFEPEDLELERQTIEELRRLARETKDKDLEALAQELTDILDQTQKGHLSKAEMLAKLGEAEKKYAEASADDADHSAAELEKTGRALEKNQQLKKTGAALEKNDLTQVQKEL